MERCRRSRDRTAPCTWNSNNSGSRADWSWIVDKEIAWSAYRVVRVNDRSHRWPRRKRLAVMQPRGQIPRSASGTAVLAMVGQFQLREHVAAVGGARLAGFGGHSTAPHQAVARAASAMSDHPLVRGASTCQCEEHRCGQGQKCNVSHLVDSFPNAGTRAWSGSRPTAGICLTGFGFLPTCPCGEGTSPSTPPCTEGRGLELVPSSHIGPTTRTVQKIARTRRSKPKPNAARLEGGNRRNQLFLCNLANWQIGCLGERFTVAYHRIPPQSGVARGGNKPQLAEPKRR